MICSSAERISIAVLLTCHNRREKSLACLEALFDAEQPASRELSVFLVDDGSTDGTAEAVKEKYPKVHVIRGTGTLFWNGGMRLAWATAAQYMPSDFYLWLNDDTLLDKHAVSELLACYQEALENDNRPAVITGACRASDGTGRFSYGGLTENHPVIPNGRLSTCQYINGNAVLVSKRIFEILGNLSPDYTHTMGDFDYGLRAIRAGFRCYTTKSYIATCPPNKDIPDWCNPSTSLLKRWRILHSPKGLNLDEYLVFRRRFWGWKWIIFAIKAYIKMAFPSLYGKLVIYNNQIRCKIYAFRRK